MAESPGMQESHGFSRAEYVNIAHFRKACMPILEKSSNQGENHFDVPPTISLAEESVVKALLSMSLTISFIVSISNRVIVV